MIGKTLAHYKITEKIGAGGMGEVYRATDTKLGRDVALKVLPAGFAADADRMARFDREARVLASLNHSGIASIFGMEREGELRFLAMELAEGEDLAQRLTRGALSVEDAVDVARQVAEALEEAHARGIVHRDLKPANVKVSPEGKVKVLDFGLAKALADDPVGSGVLENSPTIASEPTRAGIILGTAAYMSPEQARGRVVDPRTDVWAFGCVLYETLTGTSPFAGETVTDTLAAILEREPDWSRLPAAAPSGVHRVIRRCLRKDPSVRFHSVADARIELMEAMEAGDRDTTTPTATPGRRTGWILPTVGLAGVVVGALLATTLLRPRDQVPAEARIAATPPAHLVLPLPPDEPVMPHPAASAVAISPDSRFVAYVSSSRMGRTAGLTVGSTSMIFLRPLTGGDPVPIEGTLGGAMPFFSPDGEWIGFKDDNSGQLRKVAREGGPPIDLCNVRGDCRNARWTADGRIVFSQGNNGILEIPDTGGEPRLITAPDLEGNEKTRRFVDVLPGTDALLFMRGTTDLSSYDDAEIVVYMPRTGETRVLVEGGTHPSYAPTGHIVFARGGRLLAIPFDPRDLQVTGDAFLVLENVVTSDGYGSAQYAFSDHGTLVYVRGGPDHYYFDLMTMDTSGRVEPIPVARGIYGDGRVSPDGRTIAVSILGANASLWTYDLVRGTMTRLTDAWDNYSPVWSPDGARLFFGSNRDGTEGTWVMAVDGAGEPRFVAEIQAGFPEDWSSDGRLLSFSNSGAGRPATDIWTYTEESGAVEPLVASKHGEFLSRFSPDCKRIAYVSDESGQPEVYVQEVPATGRKWKLSTRGGEAPVWAPDGRSIYYWQRQSLMVVPVRLEPEFAPERARPLIDDVPINDVQAYDIFPDGERFLIVGRSGSHEKREPMISPGKRRVFPPADPDLHVVTNWFATFDR